MLPTELESELAGLGEPKYRAGQIFKWLSEGVRDFDKMSNLLKALREKPRDGYELYEPKVLSKQVSKLDGTIKYLWEPRDGNAVETVVMSYKHGNTVCISSQVGRRQGRILRLDHRRPCPRLEPSEMLDEVLFFTAGFRQADI